MDFSLSHILHEEIAVLNKLYYQMVSKQQKVQTLFVSEAFKMLSKSYANYELHTLFKNGSSFINAMRQVSRNLQKKMRRRT